MKNKFIFVAIVLSVILFFSFNALKYKIENITEVKIAGQSIKVELALTPAEQARGLSGRESLKDDEGMLFVFSDQDKNKTHKFWMKDMNFPIDMIWIDKDKKVIYIKKDARPESYPNLFGPDVASQYVLETVSGFADKNNLKIGDGVELTR